MKNVICKAKMDNSLKINQSIYFYDDCTDSLGCEYATMYTMITFIANTVTNPVGVTLHSISWPCKKSEASFKNKAGLHEN